MTIFEDSPPFCETALKVVLTLLLLLTISCSKADNRPGTSGVVNVYSGRHYDSDRVLFDAFTKATGVRVNLIEAGGDALIERLTLEADASPADVFLTADAGMLWRAEERGLFRPISRQSILERVPARFRGPGENWVGLSKRARIIIYNKEQGLPAGLVSYQGLADPQLRGQVCIRSSSNIYNQSLLASMIAHSGPKIAADWARNVVANFARKPQGNDTTQIEAVAAGICRLGVVNSYYVARYLDSADPRKLEIGEKVGVLFPNQKTTGAHINISGVGVLAHAPNLQNAEELIEFLLKDDSQRMFARGNNEYPIVESISAIGPIASLGDFRADALPVQKLGEYQTEAVKIFDAVGWP